MVYSILYTMTTQTRQKILSLIKNKGKMRAHDFKKELGIGAVAIHRQLKRLIQEEKLIKQGTPPYVFYSLSKESQKKTEIGMKRTTDKIISILLKYGVKKAALFGSYARGEHDEKSDIDILIDPPPQMGLTFIDLQHNLEDILHKKVDLVSYNGISKYLKKYILAGQIPLL